MNWMFTSSFREVKDGFSLRPGLKAQLFKTERFKFGINFFTSINGYKCTSPLGSVRRGYRQRCIVGSIHCEIICNHNSKICGVFGFNSLPVAQGKSYELRCMICGAFQNSSPVQTHSVQNVFHCVMTKNRNYTMVHG